MASRSTKPNSKKRAAETEDGGLSPRASKAAKIEETVDSGQDSSSDSSDPESKDAPTTGRRPKFPEGPPRGPPSNLDDSDMLSLLRRSWDEDQTNRSRRVFKKLTRKPRADGALKPPMGMWGSEDPARVESWKTYFETRPPADPRRKKANKLAKEVYVIQPEDFHELTPGENVILYDESDDSVARVVIWDFIKDGSVPGTLGHGLIEWMNETLCKLGSMNRGARRDDLGNMPQLGYTVAQTSKKRTHDETELPRFDWSRGMTSTKKRTVGEMRGFLHEATSIQSLLWSAYQQVLPAEVIEDFRETMECHGLPPMDWNMKGKPVNSNITVKANGKTYDLSGFELGPPAAVSGMNYAKVIHHETNGNEYVISFTSLRTTKPNEGRNFMFAKYGVKVPNARNTVIVHRVTDAHGTTLPHRSPEEDEDESIPLQQSGISMMIQQGLPSAWSTLNGESKKAFEAKKRELIKRRSARHGARLEVAVKDVGEGSESAEEGSDDGEEGGEETEE